MTVLNKRTFTGVFQKYNTRAWNTNYDWEVFTFSDYFNDYSESLNAYWYENNGYTFLSDEPVPGSPESELSKAYWFRSPAPNQFVEHTGFMDEVFLKLPTQKTIDAIEIASATVGISRQIFEEENPDPEFVISNNEVT